jgi:hypothetical protein
MFAALAKWIWAGLAVSMSGLIGRAFVALGIGYGTYNFLMPDFVAFVQGQLGGLPGNMVAVLAAAKVDVAVTIIFSAVATKLASRLFFRRT